jgi:hypothetical protein
MLLKILLFFLLFPAGLIPADFISADQPPSVIINEICWMGNSVSSNDEWIELYNTTDDMIDFEGWILKASDGSPQIELKGKIQKKSFYILERTDENTLPEIPADQIYTGALKNEGEKLELYNKKRELADYIDCSSGWFAGDNDTKQTMERKSPEAKGNDSFSWQTSRTSGGTPGLPSSKEDSYPGFKENLQETEDAGKDIQEKINNSPLPLRISFSAVFASLGLSLFSTVSILFLKKTADKRYNKV